MDSILNSIKKLNGIDAADKSFDVDIIIHINSAFMKLNQLGVGPSDGYFIEDAITTWDEYEPNRLIAESIKTFVYIKVRIIFDPPTSSVLLTALQSTMAEEEWRIMQWVEQHTV